MSDIYKEIEIELLETDKMENNKIQLPMNFISIGEVLHEDIKLYIKQDIFKTIEEFSASDKSRELGGILIGDYSEELGKMNVIISGYIEAKFTDASSSTLTFTHETWEDVHKEHARLYPGKKIIGWHHTHPRYGIFLSNYDIFIHQNFFNLPWQIAYVVDPINNTRGFFQWKNDSVQGLNGFCIFDDLQKKIKAFPCSAAKVERKDSEKIGNRLKIIKAAMIAVLVFLTVLDINLILRLNKVNEVLNNTQSKSKELYDKYNGLKDKNNELSSQLNQLEQDVYKKNESNDINGIILQKYKVQKGDTIASICRKLNIDYSSQIGVIKAINSIEDLNKIYTGQELLLPKR